MSPYDPKLVRFYIHIYIIASFEDHNLGTCYSRKLKFAMILIQT